MSMQSLTKGHLIGSSLDGSLPDIYGFYSNSLFINPEKFLLRMSNSRVPSVPIGQLSDDVARLFPKEQSSAHPPCRRLIRSIWGGLLRGSRS